MFRRDWVFCGARADGGWRSFTCDYLGRKFAIITTTAMIVVGGILATGRSKEGGELDLELGLCTDASG